MGGYAVRTMGEDIMKDKIDWRVICVGLLCLTAIEICALLNGINGIVLSSVIAVIALAIGVVLPNPIKR